MKLNILILADPYGKPSYTPRLRYLCNYLAKSGHTIAVYTEQFLQHDFPHVYPIIEKPITYHNQWQWGWQSLWSLLTDWRNRKFSQWVREQVCDKQFDLVFCTTFSTFPLRAAYEVAHEKKIPLITDIRDLDEQIPGAQYQNHRQWWTLPFRNWYKMVNIHRRNRVLRQTNHVTTISPWHVDFIRRLNKNVTLIYNGYDPTQFYADDIPTDTFRISYIGRIYEFQTTKLIEKAIQDLNLPNVELNIHTPNVHPISPDQVGSKLRHSSIVLVLTNPNAKGMMTTKFFEALGCEKPVLCIPSDNGLLAQTIRKTNAGLASSDINEIKKFILDKYHEWQQHGYTRQAVVNKEQFSREAQAQQFEQLFLQCIQ